MDPPVGSKEFFGTAPHHRFFPFHVTNILNSVRRCPKVLSPGRLLDYVKEEVGQEAFTEAVDGLMTMLAEHPSVTVCTRASRRPSLLGREGGTRG